MNKSNKILLIDDDIGILDALQIVLKEAGYVVKTKTDGEKIKSVIADFKPDVILLDIWMSTGKGGVEIATEIKQISAFQHIPIIMISALSDTKNASKLARADDYLVKPFTIKEVLQKVTKYLSIA